LFRNELKPPVQFICSYFGISVHSGVHDVDYFTVSTSMQYQNAMCPIQCVRVCVWSGNLNKESQNSWVWLEHHKKSNEKFTYRHWNCCWLLFYQL